MTHGCKPGLTLLFIFVASTVIFAVSCRQNVKPPTAEPTRTIPGEPETYTATIVRSITDDERNETSETHVSRSGDMRREEWTDRNERLALITRFDSGKSFLLNLNKQIYTETDIALKAPEKSKTGNTANTPNAVDTEKAEAENNQQSAAMDFVEDSFTEEPVSIENRALADEYIDNQLCKVTERRSSFADGRTEVIRMFCAESLSGLAMKTERETSSSTHHIKVVTEWRDIKFIASADDFAVPANFKKVQSFSMP